MPHFVRYLSSIVVPIPLGRIDDRRLSHRRRFIHSVLGSPKLTPITRDIAIGIATFIGVFYSATLLKLRAPIHSAASNASKQHPARNGAKLTRRTRAVGSGQHGGRNRRRIRLPWLSATTTDQLVWSNSNSHRSLFLALRLSSLLSRLRGVLQTACLGATYSVVALRRGNLRSVMIAHFSSGRRGGHNDVLRN